MVSFEEEMYYENGYEPLTQNEKKAICDILNIAEDKLLISNEFGIDFLHAVELTGSIYQKTSLVAEKGRELFPYDLSSVVVIWYKVLEKLVREIYVPVIKKIIPDHQIALQHKGEENCYKSNRIQ